MKKHNLLKKADIILVAVVLLISLIFLLLLKSDGKGVAVIYLEGKEHSRIDLSDTKTEQIINIGNVCIRAYDGEIRVISSDCPDKVCVNSGAVSKNGSVIACVPNKIVIAVEKNNNYVDGVTG